MDLITLLIILVIAFFVVFFGRILSFGLKFAFYSLLVVLVIVFIFDVSFSEVINFLKNLVFMTF